MTWVVCALCSGVANIMAYSWFSHCKKYLEALELEKRFIKTQKVCPSFSHSTILTQTYPFQAQDTDNASSAAYLTAQLCSISGPLICFVLQPIRRTDGRCSVQTHCHI